MSEGPNFSETRINREKGEINEDTDTNSNIGVTAHGARSASGATTDARADEGTADDSAGEREEDASRARAEQTAGKT